MGPPPVSGWEYRMVLGEYKHTKYDLFKLMNKERFPQTTLSWSQYEQFNEIYAWARENCRPGVKTKSGGIASGAENRYHSIYFYNKRKCSVELIIAHRTEGCYKFVITTERSSDESVVSGKKAQKTLFKKAEEYGVLDVLKEEAVDKETGLEIKKTIDPPIIRVVSDTYKGREFDHCYHLDLNSSYASRIAEHWPALRAPIEEIYKSRHENNNMGKSVLTNAPGAFQSAYCIDINNKYYNTTAPYQLAIFAKVAINNTCRIIQEYTLKLWEQGFEPLLINTDGIWYRDKRGADRCFHDEHEGTELGQWKTDHKNVKLYIKSAGAYQYIEDGKCKTTLRGTCDLDFIKPDRDTWGWREIDGHAPYRFEFVEGIGIIRYGETDN